MRSTCNFTAPFFLLFLIFSCTKAQKWDVVKSKIDSLAESKEPRTFSGVVYIEQNGKMVYSKAIGFSNFETQTPLSISSRFSTMSIAKQITATLILLEVERGTIDLEKNIRYYLPDFNYDWADKITIHQLLNHTSGLNSDSLEKPLKFEPGTSFSYSNIGFSVAGLILEKQSGKSYEELVTALFKRCKMKDSFYPTQAKNQLIAKGHTITLEKNPILREQSKFLRENYFGSHLIVSAPDLAKWNTLLHNGKILKSETYHKLIDYKVKNAHQLFGESEIGYGYGLRVNDTDSIKEFGHTGFHPNEGFTAVNLYYPKSKTSIVILENVANENFDIAYFYEQEVRKIVKNSTFLN